MKPIVILTLTLLLLCLEAFAQQSPLQSSSLDQSKQITCQNRIKSDLPDGKIPMTFLPLYKGRLIPEVQPSMFIVGRCYDYIFVYRQVNSYSVHVQVEAIETKVNGQDGEQKQECTETFFLGNTFIYKLDSINSPGQHTIVLGITQNTTEFVQKELESHGISVFQFCSDKSTDIYGSIRQTLKFMAGGLTTKWWLPWMGTHVPSYMEKSNLLFLKEVMGREYQIRPKSARNLHPDDYMQMVNSGDNFLIHRMDGIDPLIMYGTGSEVGHTTMALWFLDDQGNRKLYIVESQDIGFWPTEGIQRTEFKQWIKQAKRADFNTIWLPLSKENARKFNETAAREWFFKTQHLPYGYHNFIYGWIDTAKQNYPPLLSPELLPIVCAIVERVIPNSIWIVFTSGLNKRIGSSEQPMSVQDISLWLIDKNQTFQDLIAIPEQDGWLYTGIKGSDGMAFVCSSYVVSMFKAAGLFPQEVQATEFGPRDLYMIDFFDKEFNRPLKCQEMDPELPYCQVMGKHRLILGPEYSSVKPYKNMNEKCPSLPDDYIRPNGC